MPPLRELEAYLFDTIGRVAWAELLDALREGEEPAAAAPVAAAFGQVCCAPKSGCPCQHQHQRTCLRTSCRRDAVPLDSHVGAR